MGKAEKDVLKEWDVGVVLLVIELVGGDEEKFVFECV